MTGLLLFPRLPRHVARELAGQLNRAGAVAAGEAAMVSHPAVTFAATGGHRIREKDLARLANDVRRLAETYGFPGKPTQGSAASFDARCAKLLHRDAGMKATEAAREEVWSFFGCVLMPDLVRWRWGGKTTPDDRFLGGDRGLRNTFGRLWWRAHLLRDDWWADQDEYELLHILSEDEITGFVDRARAFVAPLTAVALAREILSARRAGGLTGTQFHRDVFKRFFRRGVLVTYEALDEAEMREAARVLVAESIEAIAHETRLR